MELVNEFVVPRPIDQAWAVLTDIEAIAPCMPGAQLQEVEGETYRGTVKVKVGPIQARFAGQASFTELDEAAHRAVLDARGKESGGRSLARATVTAELTEQGASTLVRVSTDLTLSGRLAQFGRGAIAEISTKLIAQFADNLERTVLAEQPAEPPVPAERPTTAEPTLSSEGTRPAHQPEPAEKPAPATPPASPTSAASPGLGGVRKVDAPDAAPVDLGGTFYPRLITLIALIEFLIIVVLLVV